ncbi:MAG: hydrogenase 4 subunit F [Peptococcaceae bacterium]|jgi:hydrogenase-4 component F|nr:hydrogenase 4 subunit F [Peptococcaceae bacterium]
MGMLLLVLPLIAVILTFVLQDRRLQHAINVAVASGLLLAALFLTGEVITTGSVSYPYIRSFFYVDYLSILILDIIVVIGFLVAVYSIGYLEHELAASEITAGRIRVYYRLLNAFMFTMALTLTVRNIGLMWIAIEGTTLASVFLVGFHVKRNALEAAWKYVMICSVGIAIALLGIIFLHLSSLDVIMNGRFLDWTALYERAKQLHSPSLRLAFIFILIGFGTKAGLAPMHTWLPDAHSEAPSPISALLSGVLLNSAMYGIIRALAIVNRNLGDSTYTGGLLIGLGVLSIVTAAVFVLTQADYKRLLASSSIEHMGVIALALGFFTPAAVFAGLLHMLNHSLSKSMLFLASGNILQVFGTKQISRIHGALHVLPLSGTVFLLGLLAIAGAPPFSIFTSEVSVVTALFSTGRPLLGAIVILLLTFIFAGIAASLFKMFYGLPFEPSPPRGEPNLPGAVCLIILLIAITISGLYVPDVVVVLLNGAAEIITGSPIM